MIRIIRGLLDQLEAANAALTMHGRALIELADDLESSAIPPAAAAALLRVLANEEAAIVAPNLSEPPPIVDTGKP